MTTTVQPIVITFLSQSTITQIFCGDGLKLEIPYQPYLNVVQINKIYYLIFLFAATAYLKLNAVITPPWSNIKYWANSWYEIVCFFLDLVMMCCWSRFSFFSLIDRVLYVFGPLSCLFSIFMDIFQGMNT